jgi:nickel-type superoxide dismutase maturation protease
MNMGFMARWVPIFRVKVIGSSMLPSLENGEIHLAVRGHIFARRGAIAVFAHPQRPALTQIKRLVRKSNGTWWVEGDNAQASTDSREFGGIDPALIQGILLRK